MTLLLTTLSVKSLCSRLNPVKGGKIAISAPVRIGKGVSEVRPRTTLSASLRLWLLSLPTLMTTAA
jgi:hypothetical protein